MLEPNAYNFFLKNFISNFHFNRTRRIYVFLLILFSLPFFRFVNSIHSYYVSGWLISGFLVFLIPNKYFNSKNLILAVLFFILSFFSSGDFDINLLPLVLIFCLFFSIDFDSLISANILRKSSELAFVILSIFLFLNLILDHLSHVGNSVDAFYKIKFVSSRNMIFEYYSLLMVIHTNLTKNRKTLIYHLIGIFLCLIFLSKCALLVFIISLINLTWKKRKDAFFRSIIKNLLIPLTFIFISINIINTINYYSNKTEYLIGFEKRNAHFKELDIIFQLNSKYSSTNLRKDIYKGSNRMYSVNGLGIGNWKLVYNCINEIKNNEILRRAHNEIIRYVSELGIFSIIPFFIFIINIKYLYPLLPLFLFSYPTERAEFLSILLLIPQKKYFVNISVNKTLVLLIKIISILLIVIWTRVNYLQYDIISRYGNYSSLSNLEKKILNISKRDFLLNPTETLILKDLKYPEKEKKELIKKIKESKKCELIQFKNRNSKMFNK